MQTLLRTGLWAALISGAVALSGCAENMMAGDASADTMDEPEAAAPMSPMEMMMADMEARERVQQREIAAARRSADRAFAMAERNQSAIRALSDKLDRMFADMSRK